MQTKQTINETEAGGVERRAFQRHPLRLRATVMVTGQGTQPAEIRDFCIGGMLLAQDDEAALPFAVDAGDAIEIRCRVPLSAGATKDLSFRARVARADAHSMGVSFIEPDLAALQALQDHALRTRPAASATPAEAETEPGGAQVLSACRRLIEEALESLAQAFLEQLVDHLFKHSRDTRSVAVQNAYFDALNILDRSGADFRKSFRASAQACLAAALAAPAARPAGSAITSSALALVEERAFEEWLAETDIIHSVENKYHELLTEIEQRLTRIYGIAIEKENDPFGPALFTQAFRDALERLSLDHVVAQTGYSLFKTLLLERGAALYPGLNRTLAEHGILPAHAPKIPRAPDERKAAKKKRPAVPAGGEPAPAADDIPADAARHDAPPPGACDETHKAAARGGNAVAPPAAAAQGDAAPPVAEAFGGSRSAPPVAAPRAGRGGRAVPQMPAQDIYQLVEDLRSLKQQLIERAPRAEHSMPQRTAHGAEISRAGEPAVTDAAQAPSADTPDAAQYYTASDLIEALSRVQLAGSATARSSRGDLKAQLLTTMAEQGGRGGKRIGVRESRIMDVATNLHTSLLKDLLIADSVQGWIKKLEIPLLKIALLDDSLFLDKGHVARQVINKLAQLELYGGGAAGQNAITAKIDRLLDRIAREIDVNQGVFKDALKELDLLTRLQNRAFAENLQEVVAVCEREQERAPLAPPAAAPADDEEREWLARVERLKTGQWIFFRGDAANPQRLQLAWTARDRSRFVFVNLRGLHELSLDRPALARRLRAGAAIVLDNADEPAMDRAQYTMLQSLHHQLLHETTHDHLTGLLNRREFERRLKDALGSARSKGLQHVFCYFDIDRFSVINNTCGHGAGDRLLIEFVALLRRATGNRGALARLGSDKFAVLLEETPLAEARRIAELQAAALRDYRFPWEDKRLAVSASVGMVVVDARSGSVTDLLHGAEASCRLAKERGGSQIQAYSADDARLSEEHQVMQWVACIDEYLDKGYLELRCQKIVPVDERAHSGPHHSEVLLAVRDQDGSAVPTERFIRAAEHYHRMAEVDRWVIGHVFHWMAKHPERVRAMGGLAINLSGRSLNDETFLGFIQAEARESGVMMERVCFEVTETAGISNLSSAAAFIEEMKKTGCKFSLDDFGSGLSSYGYLKNLPVDYLKIDGAFVKDLLDNPSDHAVVKSITEIGHFMGKQIIAEFVESQGILERLREIGVDYAQGYAIEKPRPLSELAG